MELATIKRNFEFFLMEDCFGSRLKCTRLFSLVHIWEFNGKVTIYDSSFNALEIQLSKELYYIASIAVHNRIFLFGGKSFYDFNELNINAKTLQPLAPNVEQKNFFAICHDGISIYCIGGSDNKRYLKSSEKYDISKNTWNKMHLIHTPRDKCCSSTFNRKYIYLIGGFNGSYLVNIERCSINPHSEWNKIYVEFDSYKMARSRLGAFQDSNTSILMFGGSCDYKCDDSYSVLVNGGSHFISEGAKLIASASFWKTCANIRNNGYVYAIDYERVMHRYELRSKHWELIKKQ